MKNNYLLIKDNYIKLKSLYGAGGDENENVVIIHSANKLVDKVVNEDIKLEKDNENKITSYTVDEIVKKIIEEEKNHDDGFKKINPNSFMAKMRGDPAVFKEKLEKVYEEKKEKYTLFENEVREKENEYKLKSYPLHGPLSYAMSVDDMHKTME